METWFDIQGCAFWSHKDSEWAVILLIQLSPFEWQYGLTYKATPTMAIWFDPYCHFKRYRGSCCHWFSTLNVIMLGHSPLVSFQYTEQTEVWISLSFSSAIIRPIWKVEMITQWSLVDTSHWSLRQLSSSIIILAVQIRNTDYPRNSWIFPL